MSRNHPQHIDIARDIREFDAHLDEICPSAGLSFDGKEFLKLCGPIVYLFLGPSDSPLYVGKSKNGIGRPSSNSHEAKDVRSHTRTVLVYPCASESQASALERFLIRKLKPRYNKAYNKHNVKQYIGMEREIMKAETTA